MHKIKRLSNVKGVEEFLELKRINNHFITHWWKRGLWSFSSLFPERKCFTREKEKLFMFVCMTIHNILWLSTHRQNRFLIISLTNSLCFLAWVCLILRQITQRSRGNAAVHYLQKYCHITFLSGSATSDKDVHNRQKKQAMLHLWI